MCAATQVSVDGPGDLVAAAIAGNPQIELKSGSIFSSLHIAPAALLHRRTGGVLRRAGHKGQPLTYNLIALTDVRFQW